MPLSHNPVTKIIQVSCRYTTRQNRQFIRRTKTVRYGGPRTHATYEEAYTVALEFESMFQIELDEIALYDQYSENDRINGWIAYKIPGSAKREFNIYRYTDTTRNTVELRVTQDKTTIFDNQYLWLVLGYSWCISSRGYAVTCISEGKIIPMHRLLFPHISGDCTPDHKDINKLNNTESNIRAATVKEQDNNKGGMCTNKSGITGVSYDKTQNRYVAFWSEDGKRMSRYFLCGTLGIHNVDAKQAASQCRVQHAKRLNNFNGLDDGTRALWQLEAGI